jgi:hypothetical protein
MIDRVAGLRTGGKNSRWMSWSARCWVSQFLANGQRVLYVRAYMSVIVRIPRFSSRQELVNRGECLGGGDFVSSPHFTPLPKLFCGQCLRFGLVPG